MKTITYAEKRFFEWHEDDVSVTLRNKSGSYGGGSEVLVVSSFPETCAERLPHETIKASEIRTSPKVKLSLN